ncbi:MAG: hypothetical protein OQJ84_05055 [Xanthomonadales bacterium]|nr:hypothetical protein [Xanthomonadales bacterium]
MTLPIPPFEYLERYRNEGTRTYSSHAAYTEAESAYRPDSPRERFELPLFEFPRDQMLVYTANPPAELAGRYLADNKVMFAIHPQVLKSCQQDGYVQRTLELSKRCKTMSVAPSSSTRTLYALEQPPLHAVKVHFPFKISRYGRRMRHEVLEQAINVSRELEAGIGLLDEHFAFLREVIAVCHPDLDPGSPRGEHWGYLVRDMQPFPIGEANARLIPGFALYGRDFFDSGIPLLLHDLIGRADPLTFVLDNIMLPIVRHWVACFRHFGYLMEPHGQNVIFEVDPAGKFSRIIHRDLSVGIDVRRRRDIGLSNRRLNRYNLMDQDRFHSIVYDRFMGGHFFDRLVQACLENHDGLSREDFTGPCREEFARAFPEHREYFPRTVWYFSEERDEFNKPLYQDTGAAPEWRP